MSRKRFGPGKHPGSRQDSVQSRLDEAAKQLEIAAANAEREWRTEAIAAMRADVARLQGFETALELREGER